MSEPINITGAKEFKEKVLESETPVLVDFWAPWCMPCRMMAPVLEDLARDLNEKLVIAKLNTEESENRDLAFLYEIRSIPNMKLFKKGKVSDDFIGFRPKEIFQKELEKLV
jgi:thioredoxin 1